MSDLISRKALLDKMIRRKSLFCTNQDEFMLLSNSDKARADEIDNCIADLRNAPSVEPERKEGKRSKDGRETMSDLIDRQMAIALAKDICVPTKDGALYRHRCIDPGDIAELPSAEPEKHIAKVN